MSFITNIINEYGLIAIFVIILLEYACFPVSSEIVLPFSGAVASVNQTSFLIILPLSVIAGLIGTGICYAVGWYGGGAIINGISHKFPKAKKGIESANENFKVHGASAVCIAELSIDKNQIALIAGASKLHCRHLFYSLRL